MAQITPKMSLKGSLSTVCLWQVQQNFIWGDLGICKQEKGVKSAPKWLL